MRKLYLFLGLALLVPVLDVAACGGGDNPGSGGGKSAGSAGGQVQDYPYDITVTWTIAGLEPKSDVCSTFGVVDVVITLSGTEDPSERKQVHAQCADGSAMLTSLTRLRTGSAPFVEGTLVNATGGSIATSGVEVMAAAGTVSAELPFLESMAATTATSGPGPGAGGSGGGMGGMGGMGGAGGASAGGGGAAATSGASSSSTGP